MSATAAQHDAHLDAEQLAGDLAEAELVVRQWRDLDELAAAGLPLDPPPSPEDEEMFPPDTVRTAA